MSGTQNMSAKFNALVKSLDHGALETLRRSVVSEIKGRDQWARPADGERVDGVHIDSIRPGMSAPDKEKAAREIARVLREQG